MSEVHRTDYDAFDLQVEVESEGNILVSFHTGGACRVSMSLEDFRDCIDFVYQHGQRWKSPFILDAADDDAIKELAES